MKSLTTSYLSYFFAFFLIINCGLLCTEAFTLPSNTAYGVRPSSSDSPFGIFSTVDYNNWVLSETKNFPEIAPNQNVGLAGVTVHPVTLEIFVLGYGASNADSRTLWRINPETWTATKVSGTVFSSASRLAISCRMTSTIFVQSHKAVWAVDITTGSIKSVSQVSYSATCGTDYYSLCYDYATNYLLRSLDLQCTGSYEKGYFNLTDNRLIIGWTQCAQCSSSPTAWKECVYSDKYNSVIVLTEDNKWIVPSSAANPVGGAPQTGGWTGYGVATEACGARLSGVSTTSSPGGVTSGDSGKPQTSGNPGNSGSSSSVGQNNGNDDSESAVESTPSGDGSGISVGLIAGVAVGIIAGLSLLGLAIFVVVRRRKRNQGKEHSDSYWNGPEHQMNRNLRSESDVSISSSISAASTPSEMSENTSMWSESALSKTQRTRAFSFLTERSQLPTIVGPTSGGVLTNDNDPWVVPFYQLFFGKELGRGAFGVVYQGRWKDSVVAIKQMITDNLSEHDMNVFINEMKTMMSLQPHPNLVTLLGICSNPLSIVTEFLENGSLHEYLCSKGEIPEIVLYNVALGVARGMKHLHEQGIVHRDLNSNNILLTTFLQPKINDFGLSRDQSTNTSRNTTGALRWAAPEVINNGTYNFKSDAWSFAITLCEMYTRKLPYNQIANEVTVAAKVASGELKCTVPVDAPEYIQSIVESCLQYKPANRPSFDKIVEVLENAKL